MLKQTKSKQTDETRPKRKKIGVKGDSESHSEDKLEQTKSSPTVEEPHRTRIFLYLHLKSISELPRSENKLELHLSHPKNTLTKLEDTYTTDTHIDLSIFETHKPTFSITIDQDSIDDINLFSDYPLLLTLCEHIIPIRKSEESFQSQSQSLSQSNTREGGGDEEADETEDERLVSIAKGNIDLLRFFNRKRCVITTVVFLYPLSRDSHIDVAAYKTIWEIYTLLPLLKDISLTNMVFITLESIYNLEQELMKDVEDLMIRCSFLSTGRASEKIEFCTYGTFYTDVVQNQRKNIQWETLKFKDMKGQSDLGFNTDCTVTIHKTFKGLLSTEGSNLNYDEILMNTDCALISNSLHRFVLTDEHSAVLQDMIACNRQNILLELFNVNNPDEILMQGVFDLSVLTYPRVNACRFAVELHPVISNQQIRKQKSKNTLPNSSSFSLRKTKRQVSNQNILSDTSNFGLRKTSQKTSFAILDICLLTPITESLERLSDYSELQSTLNRFSCCRTLDAEKEAKAITRICEENYKLFDAFMKALIDHVVKKDIRSLEEDKNFFCCTMRNLTNKIIPLIACDFNIRIPTETSYEFMNFMTIVYKELEKRVYNYFKICENPANDLCLKITYTAEVISNIIECVSVVKYAYEVGNEDVAELIFDKLKNKYPDSEDLNFYIYIYDMEKLDFAAAKAYQVRPLNERSLEGEYYSEFIAMYINYMENINNEAVAVALETLFITLKTFINRNPSEIISWILLHCLYKICHYLPGVSYTRWKYENLYDIPIRALPHIPTSRWNMYNPYKPNFKTAKGIHFYKVMKRFLCLGMYKFAQMIFQEISNECTAAEKYLMNSTFTIFLDEAKDEYTEKTFSAKEIIAFQAQVNGNLNHFCDEIAAATEHYALIVKTDGITDYEPFQLGLLRYGNQMLVKQNYEQAHVAFEKCIIPDRNNLLALIGMGKALYRMNRFEEAIKYFAESTTYRLHIPDVWAYLALTNLKLGKNYNALESWKHAKINNNKINEEILEELNKINYSDICLYVDKPEAKTLICKESEIEETIKSWK